MRIRAVAIVLCLLAVLSVLASCGVNYTEEEVISAASELIEKSYAINEIYFGYGLPVIDRFGAEEYENDVQQYDVRSVTYLNVTEDCGYQTIDEIKADTSAVYSSDYCEYLFTVGFEGFSDENSEDNVVYARYIENEYGLLCARSDLRLVGHELKRTYDFDTIEVTQTKAYRASVTLQSMVDGKADVSVNLTLVLESGQWRLDTPTY